jgi:predicted  nucleic acid-binding Zn-ribbon protein
MARTLNKLDRMGLSESALGEETLEEVKDNVAEAMAALESFEEQREAASDSFGEAQGYHEERDWESRDSSLDEAAGAIDEMSSALDEIESHSDVVKLPDGQMETLRKMVSEIQEHLGHLL